MNVKDLYKLEKTDIEAGAEVLAKSFYDYPMFQYILGDKLNKDNMLIFLKFLLKYSILYGEAYACSSNMEGIIMYADFKKYNMGLIRSIRCGALSFGTFGGDTAKRFNEFDNLSKKVHNKCIQDLHRYIVLIGVDPEKQGSGYGSKLLRPVLEDAKQKGLPVFLETHGEHNVEIYKHYGFKVVSTDVIPGSDIVQYAMLTD